MIVAMIAVRMVQMPVHKVIDVITVWYRRMSTVRSVYVTGVVAFAVVRDATVGIDVGHGDAVFIVVIFMGAVQVPVVQVTDVVTVLHGDVTAAGAVRVVVVLVDFVRHVQGLQFQV